ncbi:MAG: DUF2027 domain-containing protein [Bacteroidales bacterium]|nr:DUF2027 domain-containing protein [Bacteroidales bacterium]
MNIGDKVRFLNSTGGGKITGFQGRDLVLVCDDDGFEVPTLRTEVVVVETDNYNFVRPNQPSKETPSPKNEGVTSVKAVLSRHHEDESEEEERDLADVPITFKARPLERRGGEKLNLHLAFLPVNSRQLTTTRFESYLVNDSNLYVRYLLLTQEGTQYRLRHEGVVLPNQKNFIEEFSHNDLPEIERLTLQILAYKTDKSFELHAPLSITLRIDGTKFYKLHTFQESDFFDEVSLLYDLVRDDQPAHNISINAQEMAEAIMSPQNERSPQPARVASRGVPSDKGTDRNALVEIDLHADALLETTAGMENKDILTVQLKAFHEAMKAHAKERGRRIVFIHGKGDGVLRATLLKELKRYYRQCSHQDASFREYGFGATMVTIR